MSDHTVTARDTATLPSDMVTEPTAPNVVARFYVDAVTKRAYNPGHVEVVLKAAGRGEQNKSWAQWTPSGELKMQINNPPAAAFFEQRLGQDIEMTFRAVGEDVYLSEHATTPLAPSA